MNKLTSQALFYSRNDRSSLALNTRFIYSGLKISFNRKQKKHPTVQVETVRASAPPELS